MKAGIVHLIITYVLIIVLGYFAFLYFTHPRVVSNTIVEKIPDVIKTTSEPSPPDSIKVDDEYIEHIERPVDVDSISLYKKSFRQELLGVEIRQNIEVWSTGYVDKIKGDVLIFPDKEYIVNELNRQMKEERKRGMKSGILIGAGCTILVVSTIAMLNGLGD